MKVSSILSDAPLFIDDTPGRTTTEISAVARRVKRNSGLGLVVIDYIGLIEPDNPLDPRQEQVAKNARRLKGLARELNVPVLCLAQVNRQVEASKDTRPKLSNLRESGAIEQDADVVMFVHREEYGMKASEVEEKGVKGQAEIIVAKQRNGPVGDIKLAWLSEFTLFANLASDDQYTEYSNDFVDYNAGLDTVPYSTSPGMPPSEPDENDSGFGLVDPDDLDSDIPEKDGKKSNADFY